MSKLYSKVPTLLQAKMAQLGKQMRVGARKRFAYHSVKLVLLPNGNRHEVDYLIPIRSLIVVKLSIHLKYCPVL
jgi:hypothetical protein